MANNNIGPKRLVVGAHYGVRDWLAQRLTALVMVTFTVILLIAFLAGGMSSYEAWAGLFSHLWFKIAVFVTFLSLFYHAWVGAREIVMDYCAKSVGLRLALYVATILWLVGCAGWAAQIIWRM